MTIDQFLEDDRKKARQHLGPPAKRTRANWSKGRPKPAAGRDRAHLSKEEVRHIKQDLALGMKRLDVAYRYDRSPNTIYNIATGKTHKDVIV